ncbi:MAG: hypothetical protein A2X05_16695 [Bacteroidetes bacterium GWE2_41_25]|nr:MAG: hypothetical protein A2X06_07175 [Bacteroidetes bacterium GWC2_40_22]OFY11897.1 MAG: hypothetical protein A2X05_16695 [Bacteroidetes bacterium GWE2_41_25]HBH82865.1 DUF1080 domain-containing protein [Bacteroidales bacterium]HCU18964.1 DUF1080 domain-containing protein [Bacteroidales bacterium]
MACRVVVLIGLMTLFSCRGRTTEHSDLKIVETVESGQPDSTFIFNGRSLDGWEITNFGPQGPVSVSGGEIILGMGDGCTGITYTRNIPTINYEVSLEARRKEGNDFFCGLTFPVKNDFCTFIAGGWGGTTVGLSCINGKHASENETTTLQSFEKNRWYVIKLVVTDGKIEAWIDEEKVIDFITTGRKLSIRPEVTLSRPLGIASWNTKAGVRNIRIRSL